MIKKMAVFGVGLIGGSLALALRKANACERIIGFDLDPTQLQRAIELNVIDEFCLDPIDAVKDADMVLLAVPVGAMESVMSQIAGHLAPTVVITDAGSSKASVVAAAKFVAAQPGDNWLVLGDMAELGNDAPALHAAVGEDLKKAGITNLAATGDLCRHTVASFGDGGHWFATHEELIEMLRASLTGNAVVLVKGSRSMGMERVVDALRIGADETRSA